MKRIFFKVLFGLLSVPFLCQAKDYHISFSKDDFVFQKDGNGVLHIKSLSKDAFFKADTLLPALPYYTYHVLRPQDAKTFYLARWEKELVYGNVLLDANPEYVSEFSVSGQKSSWEKVAKGSVSNPVEFVGDDLMRGYSFASFNITPFVYEADSRDLYFVSEITLTLDGGDSAVSRKDLALASVRSKDDDILGMMVNPEDFSSFYSAVCQENKMYGTNEVEYLIVTNSELYSAFEPLVKWKLRKGVRAEIITLNEIYARYEGKSNQIKIKQCLKDYYENKGLKWVLLGGDDNIVPKQGCFLKMASSAQDVSAPSDLFYSCFDKDFGWNANGNGLIGEVEDDLDLYPEIAVSRLPVRTVEHVENFVGKLLKYEMYPKKYGYVQDLLLCGRKLGDMLGDKSDAHARSELMFDEYIAPYWDGNMEGLYDTSGSSGGTDVLNVENLKEKIDKGYHFMHMASHGNVFGWQIGEGDSYIEDDYTVGTAQGQKNLRATIMATMACHTNGFDNLTDPCLSEALIRNADGGCLAFLGSSREGWYLKLKRYELGSSFLYSAAFFESLFSGTSSYCHLGDAVVVAKRKWAGSCGGYDPMRWVQLALNLMGDPEMPVHTDEVQEFSNATVVVDGTNVTVTSGGIDGCDIALVSVENGRYFGVVKGVSSQTFTEVHDDFYVTITKPNYAPFLYPARNEYVQNITFDGNSCIRGKNIYAGNHVTDKEDYGDVKIKKRASVVFEAEEGIVLDAGFECEDGGMFEAKKK